MTTKSKWQQILESFRDKEYRDVYVEQAIDTGLPFQIRAMREARGWTQQELADRLGMRQGVVSRLESPNYGRYSLATLKRIASALDVALSVRFTPFSELARLEAELSPEDLAVPDFEHDYNRSLLPEEKDRSLSDLPAEFEQTDRPSWSSTRFAIGSGSTAAMKLSAVSTRAA